MARGMSPKRLAQKMDAWGKEGLNYSIVVGGNAGLELDRARARARAPRRSGRLARTIRVVEPRLKATARRGFIRLGLAAGSKSKRNPVPYASVIVSGLLAWAVRSPSKSTMRRPFRPTGSASCIPWYGRGRAPSPSPPKRSKRLCAGGLLPMPLPDTSFKVSNMPQCPNVIIFVVDEMRADFSRRTHQCCLPKLS